MHIIKTLKNLFICKPTNDELKIKKKIKLKNYKIKYFSQNDLYL